MREIFKHAHWGQKLSLLYKVVVMTAIMIVGLTSCSKEDGCGYIPPSPLASACKQLNMHQRIEEENGIWYIYTEFPDFSKKEEAANGCYMEYGNNRRVQAGITRNPNC